MPCRSCWGDRVRGKQKGGEAMGWERPAFVEIKMDAEINAYQDDFGDL